MSGYLQNKDKFLKYRVVADYNLDTNDFPRKPNGEIDESFDDIYIRCSKGNRIYSYGKGILVAYIPSVTRGKNILNQLDSEKYFEIETNSQELLFKFKTKDLDEVATLLKAHINKKNKKGEHKYISPYSVKNLNKSKVIIPTDKLNQYEDIISKISKKDKLIIGNINKDFVKTLITKRNSIADIKSDMKIKGVKGKDYFYIIGVFDNYLRFLSLKIEEHING